MDVRKLAAENINLALLAAKAKGLMPQAFMVGILCGCEEKATVIITGSASLSQQLTIQGFMNEGSAMRMRGENIDQAEVNSK